MVPTTAVLMSQQTAPSSCGLHRFFRPISWSPRGESELTSKYSGSYSSRMTNPVRCGLELRCACWLLILLSCRSLEAQILIDKRVTIQPIQVYSGASYANPSLTLFEAEADKVWSQAGIDIKFNTTWYTLNNATYFNMTSAQIDGLAGLTGQPWSSLGSNIIRMFFVHTIDSGGSAGIARQSSWQAGELPGDPPQIIPGNGFAIADLVFTSNRLDTIPHELGHNLALLHNSYGAGGTTNLMTAGESGRGVPTSIGNIFPDGLDYDQLTAEQKSIARAMPFAVALAVGDQYFYTPVPEPSQLVLFSGAVALGLVLLRRLRSKSKSGS